MGERSKCIVEKARMERLLRLSQQIRNNLLVDKPITVSHNRKSVKEFYCI